MRQYAIPMIVSLGLLLAGCGYDASRQSAAPAPGLVCRVEASTTCGGCDTIEISGTYVRVERRPLFTAADIVEITKSPDAATGQWGLTFRFTPEAGRRMEFMTNRYDSRRIGEYLDDRRRLPLMVGQRVISAAPLAGPFGKEMMFGGLTRTDVDAYFALLTQPAGTPPASQ